MWHEGLWLGGAGVGLASGAEPFAPAAVVGHPEQPA